MLGYIRLLLALCVLLSHVNVRVYDLNPGVIAVIIFYLLAGMVVSHLWQDVFVEPQGRLWRFYRDRLLRIMPMYILVLSISAVFLLSTGYGQSRYSPLALINNILLIPLNYYMYIDSTIMQSPKWCFIPQAWSLGAEMQAYLLLPLALMNRKLRYGLFLISFAVYIAANLNYLPADYFGYRLLCGVFFIFLTGALMHKAQQSPQKRGLLIAFYLLLALMYVFFAVHVGFIYAYTQETLIGLLIGIPLIMFASKVKYKIPYNSLAGSVSYVVFLIHFLVIWAMFAWVGVEKIEGIYLLEVITITLFLAFCMVQLFENKINSIRLRQ